MKVGSVFKGVAIAAAVAGTGTAVSLGIAEGIRIVDKLGTHAVSQMASVLPKPPQNDR